MKRLTVSLVLTFMLFSCNIKREEIIPVEPYNIINFIQEHDKVVWKTQNTTSFIFTTCSILYINNIAYSYTLLNEYEIETKNKDFKFTVSKHKGWILTEVNTKTIYQLK